VHGGRNTVHARLTSLQHTVHRTPLPPQTVEIPTGRPVPTNGRVLGTNRSAPPTVPSATLSLAGLICQDGNVVRTQHNKHDNCVKSGLGPA
jgi:hypothetical protein